MPIFCYKCDKCGATKDKLVSRKEADSDTEFNCDCEAGGTLKRTEEPTAAVLRFRGNWFGTTGKY